jgi:hypothetical protein
MVVSGNNRLPPDLFSNLLVALGVEELLEQIP